MQKVILAIVLVWILTNGLLIKSQYSNEDTTNKISVVDSKLFKLRNYGIKHRPHFIQLNLCYLIKGRDATAIEFKPPVNEGSISVLSLD